MSVLEEVNREVDLERLRLQIHPPPKRAAQLPRHKVGELFLKGPVPWNWLTTAARLPGKALHVGVVLWHRAGLEKKTQVTLPSSRFKALGVSRYAGSRALAALEQAGLVAVVRKQGRAPRVTLLPAPTTASTSFDCELAMTPFKPGDAR
jgi:hypothetical protein